jgi:hypothetical protein
MFASRSVIEHLLRGVAGLALFGAGFAWLPAHPLWALPAFVLAMVALRGCPMCWTLGLFETLARWPSRKLGTGACADGACANEDKFVASPGERATGSR